MTKLLELYFGKAPGPNARREAFDIGMSRLIDSRPILTRDVLADPAFLDEQVGEGSDDWRAAGDDLEAAVEKHRENE